jgi:hypothetical protein
MPAFLKHTLLLFTFSAIHCLGIAQTDKPEKKQEEIARIFFNIQKGWMDASDLLKQLISNTGLIPDTIIARTDTSVFYMRGYCKTFNPFAIPVKEIEIQLREGPVHVINKEKIKDTLLYLQIIAITDSNTSILPLTRETRRIAKNISPAFTRTNHVKTSGKKSRPSEGYSFYYQPEQFPFITIGFGGYYQNASIHCITLSLIYHSTRTISP